MVKYLKTLLAAVFVITCLTSAKATTVYFACGEDVCFTPLGSAVVDTTAGTFRSTYARGSLKSPDASSQWINDTAINGTTGLSSFWLTARIKIASFCGSGSSSYLSLTTSDTITRIWISDVGCGQPMKVMKKDGAGTSTQIGSSFTCTGSTALQKWDYHVQNYGASGTLDIYLDNVLCYSFTGNIATDSRTVLNGIRMGGFFGSQPGNYSEVVVADSDTRSVSLQTLQASGAGTNQTWACTAGTTYGSINKFDNSADSDDCSSGTNNQKETFTVPSLVAGTYQIWAVAQAARANIGGSGPQDFEYAVRVGGTDYLSANISPAPTTSLQNLTEKIWNTSPATSSAWVSSDFSGIEMGFQSSP